MTLAITQIENGKSAREDGIIREFYLLREKLTIGGEMSHHSAINIELIILKI